MKKKFILLLGLFLVVFFHEIQITKAEAINQNIVYLYSDDHQVNDVISDLENKDINITQYNVNEIDNMKYFYIYKEAYNISLDMDSLPVILSGNQYYMGEDSIRNNVDKIETNAKNKLKNIDDVDLKMIIYFYSDQCDFCKATKPYIKDLENEGILVIWVDADKGSNTALMLSYGKDYGLEKTTVPIVFSGTQYYHSKDDIINHLDEIKKYASSKDLLDVQMGTFDISLILVIIGGLIDGVNPCAMSMLILFIGLLLGTKSKKSTLISVAVSYILGLFVTYFALGAFLIRFIDTVDPYINNLSYYLDRFLIVFALFLFLFNLYDYFVSRKEQYGKVKNQLPKGIQKFNKKLIRIFTKSLEGKNIVVVYIISFTLGVVISLTEFLCTGQVYLPILLVIRKTAGFGGMIKLFIYNLMFIVPLVILAILAIKAQSAMETSNKIREKLHVIKLITGILFLFIAVYYILKVLGVW